MQYQQSNNRKNDLAKIHIGSTALGWIDKSGIKVDKTEYLKQLWAICRVESSADLDFAGRQKFLDHLKACGWKPTKPKRNKKQVLNNENASKGQIELIKNIWNALYKAGIVREEDGLRKYIKVWTKKDHPQKVGYDAPELLPANVARTMIERLKQWAKRTDVDWK